MWDDIVIQLVSMKNYVIVCIITALVFGCFMVVTSQGQSWGKYRLRLVSVFVGMSSAQTVKLAGVYLQLSLAVYLLVTGTQLQTLHLLLYGLFLLLIVIPDFHHREVLVAGTASLIILAAVFVSSSIRTYMSTIKFRTDLEVLMIFLITLTLLIILLFFLWEVKFISTCKIPHIEGDWETEEEDEETGD